MVIFLWRQGKYFIENVEFYDNHLFLSKSQCFFKQGRYQKSTLKTSKSNLKYCLSNYRSIF